MITVRFSLPEDFFEELEQDKESVSRRILRLSARRSLSEHFVRWSLIGSAVIGDHTTLRLDYHLGAHFVSDHAEAKKIASEADKVRDTLAKKGEALGLEVRAGVIE
jgi:NADPH-dependent ferric siderophore reductase